jgi:hypothetical protein
MSALKVEICRFGSRNAVRYITGFSVWMKRESLERRFRERMKMYIRNRKRM